MSVIIPDPSNAAAAHRELQRQFKAGQLSRVEYESAFRTIDAALSVSELCENGDGRLATARLNGKALCSACWLKESNAV